MDARARARRLYEVAATRRPECASEKTKMALARLLVEQNKKNWPPSGLHSAHAKMAARELKASAILFAVARLTCRGHISNASFSRQVYRQRWRRQRRLHANDALAISNRRRASLI